jgi:hypothetical protein
VERALSAFTSLATVELLSYSDSIVYYGTYGMERCMGMKKKSWVLPVLYLCSRGVPKLCVSRTDLLASLEE